MVKQARVLHHRHPIKHVLRLLPEGGPELLFDPALRLNPLSFLQDTSRNRLLVASWNGTLFEGDLRFGAEGHPDFFSHAVAGVPVITVSRDKLQLHLAS